MPKDPNAPENTTDMSPAGVSTDKPTAAGPVNPPAGQDTEITSSGMAAVSEPETPAAIIAEDEDSLAAGSSSLPKAKAARTSNKSTGKSTGKKKAPPRREVEIEESFTGRGNAHKYETLKNNRKEIEKNRKRLADQFNVKMVSDLEIPLGSETVLMSLSELEAVLTTMDLVQDSQNAAKSLVAARTEVLRQQTEIIETQNSILNGDVTSQAAIEAKLKIINAAQDKINNEVTKQRSSIVEAKILSEPHLEKQKEKQKEKQDQGNNDGLEQSDEILEQPPAEVKKGAAAVVASSREQLTKAANLLRSAFRFGSKSQPTNDTAAPVPETQKQGSESDSDGGSVVYEKSPAASTKTPSTVTRSGSSTSLTGSSPAVGTRSRQADEEQHTPASSIQGQSPVPSTKPENGSTFTSESTSVAASPAADTRSRQDSISVSSISESKTAPTGDRSSSQNAAREDESGDAQLAASESKKPNFWGGLTAAAKAATKSVNTQFQAIKSNFQDIAVQRDAFEKKAQEIPTKIHDLLGTLEGFNQSSASGLEPEILFAEFISSVSSLDDNSEANENLKKMAERLKRNETEAVITDNKQAKSHYDQKIARIIALREELQELAQGHSSIITEGKGEIDRLIEKIETVSNDTQEFLAKKLEELNRDTKIPNYEQIIHDEVDEKITAVSKDIEDYKQTPQAKKNELAKQEVQSKRDKVASACTELTSYIKARKERQDKYAAALKELATLSLNEEKRSEVVRAVETQPTAEPSSRDRATSVSKPAVFFKQVGEVVQTAAQQVVQSTGEAVAQASKLVAPEKIKLHEADVTNTIARAEAIVEDKLQGKQDSFKNSINSLKGNARKNFSTIQEKLGRVNYGKSPEEAKLAELLALRDKITQQIDVYADFYRALLTKNKNEIIAKLKEVYAEEIGKYFISKYNDRIAVTDITDETLFQYLHVVGLEERLVEIKEFVAEATKVLKAQISDLDKKCHELESVVDDKLETQLSEIKRRAAVKAKAEVRIAASKAKKESNEKQKETKRAERIAAEIARKEARIAELLAQNLEKLKALIPAQEIDTKVADMEQRINHLEQSAKEQESFVMSLVLLKDFQRKKLESRVTAQFTAVAQFRAVIESIKEARGLAIEDYANIVVQQESVRAKLEALVRQKFSESEEVALTDQDLLALLPENWKEKAYAVPRKEAQKTDNQQKLILRAFKEFDKLFDSQVETAIESETVTQIGMMSTQESSMRGLIDDVAKGLTTQNALNVMKENAATAVDEFRANYNDRNLRTGASRVFTFTTTFGDSYYRALMLKVRLGKTISESEYKELKANKKSLTTKDHTTLDALKEVSEKIEYLLNGKPVTKDDYDFVLSEITNTKSIRDKTKLVNICQKCNVNLDSLMDSSEQDDYSLNGTNLTKSEKAQLRDILSKRITPPVYMIDPSEKVGERAVLQALLSVLDPQSTYFEKVSKKRKEHFRSLIISALYDDPIVREYAASLTPGKKSSGSSPQASTKSSTQFSQQTPKVILVPKMADVPRELEANTYYIKQTETDEGSIYWLSQGNKKCQKTFNSLSTALGEDISDLFPAISTVEELESEDKSMIETLDKVCLLDFSLEDKKTGIVICNNIPSPMKENVVYVTRSTEVGNESRAIQFSWVNKKGETCCRYSSANEFAKLDKALSAYPQAGMVEITHSNMEEVDKQVGAAQAKLNDAKANLVKASDFETIRVAKTVLREAASDLEERQANAKTLKEQEGLRSAVILIATAKISLSRKLTTHDESTGVSETTSITSELDSDSPYIQLNVTPDIEIGGFNEGIHDWERELVKNMIQRLDTLSMDEQLEQEQAQARRLLLSSDELEKEDSPKSTTRVLAHAFNGSLGAPGDPADALDVADLKRNATLQKNKPPFSPDAPAPGDDDIEGSSSTGQRRPSLGRRGSRNEE